MLKVDPGVALTMRSLSDGKLIVASATLMLCPSVSVRTDTVKVAFLLIEVADGVTYKSAACVCVTIRKNAMKNAVIACVCMREKERGERDVEHE